MKQRLAKKWISRYITPYIKELKTTISRTNIVDVGKFHETEISNNHTIINGDVVGEGEYYKPKSYNLRFNIMKTGEKSKEIVDTHEYTLLREKPRVEGKSVRMRLITD